MTGRGLLVGRYELRGVLGRGGMAEVRDGWDTRLCRAVAIKLLHPALHGDQELRRRFEAEARAAAALEHPNVVSVHDFGEHDGTPFIVMERLPGGTLRDVMAPGPMPPWQVRAVLDDVLAGLGAAHRAGVLHRDVKPGNILLSASGERMKVADFGIAKTGGAAETATGRVIGTMCYMTPERLCGAAASVADDLYAVAVMGYEALLGRRAFPHDSPGALARAILESPPPPLSACRTDLDAALVGAIDRGMARDPGLRFTGADQMRAALAGDRGALYAVPGTASPPRPATKVLAAPLPPTAAHPAAPRPVRPATRKGARRYVIAAAICAAFLISALALATDPFSSAPSPASVSTTSAAPPTPSAPPPSAVAPPPSPVAPALEQPPPSPAPKHKPGKGNGRGDKKGR